MNNSQVTGNSVAVGQVDNRSVAAPIVAYPSWPSSVPGPLRVLPAANERPVNRWRSEQMVEIEYDQETGKSLPAGEL
ncbi:hypothetical protein [Dictyobacter formicarum]|uniref:Uncharacterized protein n=1 Tax=Dictyobacter formicarum TaxID=2778368 RepID=A0ABQ3VD58_9CHLR|nr:hypothetical protein [Dictyobacter formicarum]GHO83842.1 hypothetical protein KSZ_18480 [Dictyobacter formicarum]